MLRGGAPYRDAWDFKPPGIFLVYAIARVMFGGGEQAVRILEVTGLVSLVVAFCLLSRRFVGSWEAGLVAGALAVGTHAQLEFWDTAQPESFGGILIAWALVAATDQRVGSAKDPWRRYAAWACCAALFTAAGLLKPPLGSGLVVCLIFVCLNQLQTADRASRTRAVLSPAIAFAAGAAVVLLPTLAYFAAKDALPDVYDTFFVFVPRYTRLDFHSEQLSALVYRAFEHWSLGFSAFMACGLVFFVALPALDPRESGFAAEVGAIIALQLVGVALQAKFMGYHYGAAFPLGSLLAGWGMWKVWTRVRGRTLGILAFAVLLYALGTARGATSARHKGSFWERSKMRWTSFVQPSTRVATEDSLYNFDDVDSGSNRRVAEWLASHTPAGQPIFVWGFEPEIYVLSDRRPASRYVYNVPQRVSWTQSTRDVLMTDLERNPPSAIVVEHGDVFPWVTGTRTDSAQALAEVPRLAALLRDGYRHAERIDDFDLYLRR